MSDGMDRGKPPWSRKTAKADQRGGGIPRRGTCIGPIGPRLRCHQAVTHSRRSLWCTPTSAVPEEGRTRTSVWIRNTNGANEARDRQGDQGEYGATWSVSQCVYLESPCFGVARKDKRFRKEAPSGGSGRDWWRFRSSPTHPKWVCTGADIGAAQLPWHRLLGLRRNGLSRHVR